MGKHSKHAKTGKWTPERLQAWKESRWGKKEAKTIKAKIIKVDAGNKIKE